jgi:hypothetical protein
MSRSLWRCRNRACPVPHGAVLGRLTRDGGLVVDGHVRGVSAYFDTGKVDVACPYCSVLRSFRGRWVTTQPPPEGTNRV